MDKYNLTLSNDEIVVVEKGTSFREVIETYFKEEKRNIVLCRLNYEYYELNSEVKESGNLTLVKLDTDLGMTVYKRALQFIFIKATLDVFKNSKITIEHSISKCIFGEIHKNKALTKEDVLKIKERMIELIEKDVEIEKERFERNDAIKIFEEYGMEDKVALLESMEKDYISLYKIEDRYDYFYGLMASNTGIIRAFDLKYYEPGFILRYPEENNLEELPEFKEQKKLFNIFYETEKWLEILGIGEVGSLNKEIDDGNIRNLVLVSEALHEKKNCIHCR